MLDKLSHTAWPSFRGVARNSTAVRSCAAQTQWKILRFNDTSRSVTCQPARSQGELSAGPTAGSALGLDPGPEGAGAGSGKAARNAREFAKSRAQKNLWEEESAP